MNINFWLNGVNRHAEISPDTLLIDFLRKQGCFSVKRGCGKENRYIGRNAERSAGVWKLSGE